MRARDVIVVLAGATAGHLLTRWAYRFALRRLGSHVVYLDKNAWTCGRHGRLCNVARVLNVTLEKVRTPGDGKNITAIGDHRRGNP